MTQKNKCPKKKYAKKNAPQKNRENQATKTGGSIPALGSNKNLKRQAKNCRSDHFKSNC